MTDPVASLLLTTYKTQFGLHVGLTRVSDRSGGVSRQFPAVVSDASPGRRDLMMVLGLALALGITLGLLTNVTIPATLLTYLGVAVLAAIDSCLGGVRASLEETFDDKMFISGFITNTLMAAFIVFVGDRIGVRELYLAAVVAFGIRLFDNLGTTRRLLFSRWGW